MGSIYIFKLFFYSFFYKKLFTINLGSFTLNLTEKFWVTIFLIASQI